jgi:superfamily II DNA helicase RecQ
MIQINSIIVLIVLIYKHCINTLGKDFRPCYGRICMSRSLFPGVPILALTTTASTQRKKEITSTQRKKEIASTK